MLLDGSLNRITLGLFNGVMLGMLDGLLDGISLGSLDGFMLGLLNGLLDRILLGLLEGVMLGGSMERLTEFHLDHSTELCS